MIVFSERGLKNVSVDPVWGPLLLRLPSAVSQLTLVRAQWGSADPSDWLGSSVSYDWTPNRVPTAEAYLALCNNNNNIIQICSVSLFLVSLY